MKLSSAGTVVGIEAPNRTMNLEVKPYVTVGLRTDLAAAEPFSDVSSTRSIKWRS